MRISDWSSDVCSSDLRCHNGRNWRIEVYRYKVSGDYIIIVQHVYFSCIYLLECHAMGRTLTIYYSCQCTYIYPSKCGIEFLGNWWYPIVRKDCLASGRSEEHTSELQSLMRLS